MAELNFGILDTQAPGRIAAIPQQMADQQAKNAMQFMQVQQAMGQNELAKYQLSSARRTDEANNKLLALYNNAPDINDPNFVREVYKIDPQKGMALTKYNAERADKELTQTKTKGEIREQALKLFATRLPSLAQDPSDAGIDRFLKEAVDTGAMSFELASAKSTQLKGMELPERQKAILGAGQSAKDALAALVPKPTNMARMIVERDAMPPGRARDAMTDTIEKSTNENFVLSPTTGLPVDRRQGQQPPGAAPAQAGAPVTPATFPRDTAVQQTTRMTDATAIKRQELANEQIKLANATQKLASPAAAKDPDIRKFYEDQAKQATDNIVSLNTELGGRTNNMPGAAAAAPGVNALRAQPAAATTALNPRQVQTQFETDVKTLGAEREALGKLGVDEYKQLGTAASNARKAMPGIDTAERILNAGFNTGWGTETQAAAANILASLGVADAKNYATNAQLFLAQTRTVTNDRLLDQKGPQTDNDFKRTEEIGARLGNTADANKFLLAVNRAINNQTIEKHNFFTKWVSKNDSLKGAEQAWQDSPAGSASLFDRPELKQYAQVKPAATPTTTAKPAAPAVGEIRDGYRFKGGDPANIGRWEKVTP